MTGNISKNGRVGISTVYFKSSETKSHWHLNIKAFAFLNPCPKLINVLIWITIKWIPQMNTCVRSNVRNVPRSPCKNDRHHLGLERIPNESPTNAPHSSGKVRQNAQIPHILGTRDKAPLKPHMSRGGGGVGVYFYWCITSIPGSQYHTCQPPEYKNLEMSRNLCIVRMSLKTMFRNNLWKSPKRHSERLGDLMKNLETRGKTGRVGRYAICPFW